MFRKRMGLIAATVAAGAMLLTACNGEDTAAPAASNAAAAGAGAADAAANAAKAALSSLSFRGGTAKQNNAPANTGDFANPAGKPTTIAGAKWVQLSASKAGDLDPVVINGAGFTLYRFDKDTANPSKSNCNDACAVTWPPVVVSPKGKIFIDGIKKKDVGVVKRDDGSLQVTLGGWPVYRFSKDLKPGDTNGQGVGGTWFGVTPDGQKAGGGVAGGDQAGGGQAAKPATNAVLFDDKNFADNGSQGLAGKGCQNVSRDNIASSIQAEGSMKIWTGADCTGTSKVIDGNVADLAGIGFDNDVSSVFFG
jgi:predicted lipoprotein with Yx(FWY)xxD motif